ncbi:8018_t:CDS:10 [Rhizophagus irregularis]|nr:8018_t:CDS:10 [Rhizophagus irregularis]
MSNEELEQVKTKQYNVLLENLQSSALSYDGSDKLVFVSGDRLEGAWRGLIRKEFRDQQQMRWFITSCLLDADKQTGVAVETLVEQLGNPELGISRIREICQYNMSVDAGFKKNFASFQCVILPFLALLIRHGVRGSTLEKQLNTIYSVVYSYIDSFFHDKIMRCLDELVRRNSLLDRNVDKDKLLKNDPDIFIPSTFDASNVWKDSLLAERQSISGSEDALVSHPEKRRYYFDILDVEMRRLNYVLSDGRRSLNAAKREANKAEISETVLESRKMAKMNEFERLYDPPGARSKSDRIKEFYLDTISRSRPKISHQGFMLYEAFDKLEEIKKEAVKLQDKLSRRWMTWDDVKNYLLVEHTGHYLQFADNHGPDVPALLLNIDSEEFDQNEWTIVGEEKMKNQPIWDQWINGVDIRRREQLIQAIYQDYSEDDVNNDNLQEIDSTDNIENDETEYWLQKLVIPDEDRDLEILLEDLDVWNMSRIERQRLHDHFREATRKNIIDELSDLEKKHTAKRKEIEDINDEGRREILENCQVIGLTTSGAAKYQSLIRSVAPRVMNEDVIMSQLTTQRRMRPEIADLIRKKLYPKLIDGAITKEYPKVRGTPHNLFFINHEHPEDAAGSNQFALQSHSNEFEVAFVVELIRYFVRNVRLKIFVIDERDSQDIAELLDEADPELNSEFENPNVGTISIAEKRSLQRQGNAGLLSDRSDMWKSVINLMRERNQIGKSFPIRCESHPDSINYIKSPRQFQELSPDGGCSLPCLCRMPCGHNCAYKCHPDDPEHVGAAKACMRPCLELHKNCNHICPLPCGVPCGECEIVLEDILLPCGHNYPSPKCYQTQNPNLIKCTVMVTLTLPACGHEQKALCGSSIKDISCDHDCGIILEDCGHPCKNKCFQCQKKSIEKNNDVPILDEQGHVKRTDHLKCVQKCGRILYCGHPCSVKCHREGCPPCKEKCSIACLHSKCMQSCGDPCSACAEQCNWSCQHQGGCALSCGAPCSRLPCNLQCQKLLECGHRCISVCGEECPQEYCVECAKDEIKSQVVDIIMRETFADVDWNAHRLIVLECGHCFTMESMDSHMELEKYYVGKADFKTSETTWIGLKAPPEEISKAKCCPNCRYPINNVNRYGRVSKKIALDAAKMKFLQKFTKTLKGVQDTLEKIVLYLETTRTQFVDKIVKSASVSDKSGKPKRKHQTSNTKVPELTPVQQFAEIEYQGISQAHEKLWAKHVVRLITCYQDIFMIMTGTKDPPYKHAFDAAVVNLYRVKSAMENDIDDILNLVERMDTLNLSGSSYMRKLALQRDCLQQVGIPLPVISHGMYIKAFLEIINVQKTMFMEAKHVVEALDSALLEKIKLLYLRNNVDIATQQSINSRNSWIRFTRFILEKTIEHLKIICEIAKETKYYRDHSFASLELSEVQCTYGRFILSYEIVNDRESASEQATKMKKLVLTLCKDIQQRFIGLQNSIRLVDGDHIKQQFINRMEQVLNDVKELENSNQASSCPECGANVGGINYNLSAGNSANSEYESLYQYNI